MGGHLPTARATQLVDIVRWLFVPQSQPSEAIVGSSRRCRDMWVSRFLFSTLYSRRTQFSRAEDAFGGCTTRSTTSPSSEMMKRGDDTAPAACTYLDPVPCLLGPPPMNTPVSEGGRDDRGVPYHAESTLSSAQVLNAVTHEERERSWFSKISLSLA